MKNLKVFFAILLTVVTLTHTKPSQAAVGALVSVPVLVVGLAISGGGVLWTHKLMRDCGGDGLCGLAILITGPIILLGLIVLDGEQDVQFRELSNEEAKKIGISKADLAVYNSEVDQANMLMADVKAELSKFAKPTAQDSVNAWSSVKELVSPSTYSTMQKIVSQN